MGIFKLAGSMVRSVVDVKTWIGYDQLKSTSKGLVHIIKPMYTVQKATFQETFEEALARLHIEEANLPRIIRQYQYRLYFFLFSGAICLIYLLYLVFEVHLVPAFVTLFIVALLLIKAAEAHFYIFQIKNKKLGCTIDEWLDGKTKQG